MIKRIVKVVGAIVVTFISWLMINLSRDDVFICN